MDEKDVFSLKSCINKALAPFFQAFRKLPRKGLVAFVLKKLRKDFSLFQNNKINLVGAVKE